MTKNGTFVLLCRIIDQEMTGLRQTHKLSMFTKLYSAKARGDTASLLCFSSLVIAKIKQIEECFVLRITTVLTLAPPTSYGTKDVDPITFHSSVELQLQ
uniref:AlNc14C140G7234 protein n=1 Tax=Albugo laibachii Nc14 TaxID=890382 RepID=F0WL47_9STRA|nr:AlNc14C140G7234 [Albugo laibachii Nc14]|eukprot:CCA22007.1 AlNc14C140G7234 [Albugo laibachii Nc14]